MTNGKIFISNDQDNYVSEEYNDVILEDGLPQATIVDDYFSNEPQVVHAVSVIIPAIHYQERTPFCIQDLCYNDSCVNDNYTDYYRFMFSNILLEILNIPGRFSKKGVFSIFFYEIM